MGQIGRPPGFANPSPDPPRLPPDRRKIEPYLNFKIRDGSIGTVGHSTHPINTFIELLQAHGVTQLVDIRTIPKSRHNPQFGQDALAMSLRKAKIEYIHLKELGGLRKPRTDSPNTGWKNASFRGYADFMQTDTFKKALENLIALGKNRPTTIMCAEALPWRCHRSLVADSLTARGIPVEHLMPPKTRKPHTLTPFAKVKNGQVTYPSSQPEFPNLPPI